MKRGFTIVELLIVIIVIAILASISIVAYNGVQQRARTTALQSDARMASTQLELMKIDTGAYPSTLTASDLKLSAGNTFQYRTLGQEYCVAIENPQAGAYFISSNGNTSVGPCPVAHYKLDGDAADSSIYANNGTNTGATATTDRFGVSGGALAFNGTTSRINTPYVSALNVGQPNMTLSAWVRPNSFTDTAAIINRNAPYLLWIGTNQQNYTGLHTNASGWVFYGAGTIAASRWQHMALTFNGSQRRLYIDGVQVGVDTSYSGNVNTGANGISIGYDYCCNRYYFNGSIDDIRIYNEELTSIEVNQLFETTK